MPAVECELARVVMSETQERQVVILKEKNGERKMPIVIGMFEVFAIHRAVHNQQPMRPLTHELFINTLKALGVSIVKIVVNDLQDGIYYARLHLNRDGEAFDVDCRPSDAMALATQCDAPVFVEEDVLNEGARDY